MGSHSVTNAWSHDYWPDSISNGIANLHPGHSRSYDCWADVGSFVISNSRAHDCRPNLGSNGIANFRPDNAWSNDCRRDVVPNNVAVTSHYWSYISWRNIGSDHAWAD